MSESKVRKEETQEKEAIFSNLLQRVELLEKENLQLNNKIVLLKGIKESGHKIMELIKDFDSDEQDDFGNLLSKKKLIEEYI